MVWDRPRRNNVKGSFSIENRTREYEESTVLPGVIFAQSDYMNFQTVQVLFLAQFMYIVLS